MEVKVVTLTLEQLRAEITTAVAAALDAQKPLSDWTDQDGIAAHLGVSTATVKKLADEGLPHVYVGAHRRFSRRAVDAFLIERRAARPPLQLAGAPHREAA